MVSVSDINEMLDAFWPGVAVRCVELSETHAVAQLEVEARDLRPGGFISGPTQFALADSAFWFLVSGALGRVEPMALTAELSIRYLRPATGGMLKAVASLDRLGKRSVVATVKLWTDDPERPTSVAQGTYTLPAS